MARKYLDRKQNSDEKKSEESNKKENFTTDSDSEMKNLDPLDAEERTVTFRNTPPTATNTQGKNSKDYSNDVKNYIRLVDSHIIDRH